LECVKKKGLPLYFALDPPLMFGGGGLDRLYKSYLFIL
jgi:hypothetical protein